MKKLLLALAISSPAMAQSEMALIDEMCGLMAERAEIIMNARQRTGGNISASEVCKGDLDCTAQLASYKSQPQVGTEGALYHAIEGARNKAKAQCYREQLLRKM